MYIYIYGTSRIPTFFGFQLISVASPPTQSPLGWSEVPKFGEMAMQNQVEVCGFHGTIWHIMGYHGISWNIVIYDDI